MEGQHHRRPVSDGMSEPGNKRQRIHVAEDIRPHHSPYNALNRVVRLNVGGHKYMTTTATLIKVKVSPILPVCLQDERSQKLIHESRIASVI